MRNWCKRHAGLVLPAMFFAAWMGIPGTAGAADSEDARMKLGREVFTRIATPSCGLCHTLKDAGTTGEIGAKLEEIRPDAATVMEAVRKGLGVMPPFEGKLTEEQIQAVAHYVSRAAASAK